MQKTCHIRKSPLIFLTSGAFPEVIWETAHCKSESTAVVAHIFDSTESNRNGNDIRNRENSHHLRGSLVSSKAPAPNGILFHAMKWRLKDHNEWVVRMCDHVSILADLHEVRK